MQHSHIMAQRDGKTIIVSKAVRLTAADILAMELSRGLSPLQLVPPKNSGMASDNIRGETHAANYARLDCPATKRASACWIGSRPVTPIM
jgi:hypothetical protein